MRSICVVIVFFISGLLLADENFRPQKYEISSGCSMLLYQSVYSFQESTSIEAAIGRNLSGSLDWQLGTRLGIQSMQPDVFTRLLASAELGLWHPKVGLEAGFTNRAGFEDGEQLLRETRQAMESDISHFYIASYAAPLAFTLGQRWHLRALELHIGTHLGHTGRTMRLQVGILSIGKYF